MPRRCPDSRWTKASRTSASGYRAATGTSTLPEPTSATSARRVGAGDRELAEDAAHSPGRGGDDDRVSLGEVLRLEGVPRRLPGESEPAGHLQGNIIGHRGEGVDRGHHEVARGPARNRAEHVVPCRDIRHAGTDGLDLDDLGVGGAHDPLQLP